MKTTNNLRIDQPCPFVPNNRNKNKEGFYCKSCKKTIIDFREKNQQEIIALLNEGACGIFKTDQLQNQPKMKFSGKLVFYFMSLLSILGFTIQPISAQSMQNKRDTILIDGTTPDQPDNLENNKKREKKQRRIRLVRRTNQEYLIGVPWYDSKPKRRKK